MTRVHPSAVIEKGALLDHDVTVGAFCVIGANVKVAGGTVIGPHVVLAGDTSIGRDNHIAPFCSLGGPPQDKKYRGEPTRLVIGERNTIREYCYFNPGTIQDQGLTSIGNDNWIMGYVHVAHDCVIGNDTTIANACQLAGHVEIGDWAILGGLTGVHQYVKVGAHVMVGAHSYLNQDVPPYVLCSGAPAEPHGINLEGLKRRGFEADTLASLRQVYRLLYRQQLSFQDAKAAIAGLASHADVKSQQALRVFSDFLTAASRGVIR
jgi:UDP-N-acetylglucosamine acyltransferase